MSGNEKDEPRPKPRDEQVGQNNNDRLGFDVIGVRRVLISLLRELGLLGVVRRSPLVQGAAVAATVAVLFAIARLSLGMPTWPAFLLIFAFLLIVALVFWLVHGALQRTQAHFAGSVLIWLVTITIVAIVGLAFTTLLFDWPTSTYKLAVTAGWLPAPMPKPPKSPDYVANIANGIPQGQCSADDKGSAVQLFQNGWLLDRFQPGGSYLYAIVETGLGGLRWIRKKEGWRDGQVTPCEKVGGGQLMRWGFRWWYCAADAQEIRQGLGKPETLETGAWVQYQDWSEGLLAVGLPSDVPSFKKGKFDELASVFLDGAQEHDSGPGQVSSISPYNLKACKAYCNAVWYSKITSGPAESRTNPLLLREPGCVRKYTEKDFFRPRKWCSVCSPNG